MAFLWKAAIVAAGLACASNAHAAYFTYEFTFSGLGTQVSTFGGQFTSRSINAGVLTLGFEAPDDAAAGGASPPATLNPFGVQATTSGLRFTFGPGIDRLNATGGGFACATTPQPAALPTSAYSVDTTCSSVSYTVLDAVAQTSTQFAGTVTGFAASRRAGAGPVVFNLVSIVPEPSTWALMLAGFGMVGYALRRRPKLSCAL
jgi:hypothetical protein